jgi:hypothetical protein
MAQYQADVWLGSASGRQRVYVNANTWSGAREQIKIIYDVDDNDIQNLYESRDNHESGGDSGVDGAGILVLLVIAFLIYFWKYILIIGGIGLVIWGLISFLKDD